MKREYFDYITPLNDELKRLGYGLPMDVSEQDILLSKLILDSKYSDAKHFIYLLNDYQFRDVTKSAIRVYAYYINNPAQFNHDPHNVIGSAIRHMYNATLSFVTNVYKEPVPQYIKCRNKTINAFSEQCLSVWLDSARALAKKVKRNTEMQREMDEDLNKNEAIHIDMFKQVI